MAFPLSITARLTVRRSRLASHHDVMERLRAALLAQTVDTITMAHDTIKFIPHAKGGESKPRPEGRGWMFDSLGVCRMCSRYEAGEITIDYKLDCRFWFLMATVISVSAGLFVSLYTGPGHASAVAFGFWVLSFLSGYVSKSIEVRGWLKNNLTSLELPPTKPLRVPIDPG